MYYCLGKCLPAYVFCVPQERLTRDDQPIKKLDSLYRQHDIFCNRGKETKKRHGADKILADAAFKRFKSNDTSFREILSPLALAGVMKTTKKLHMGFTNTNYKHIIRK